MAPASIRLSGQFGQPSTEFRAGVAGARVHRVRLRRRPDPLLLALFDEAGRNAHVTSGLLRELLGVFPEPSELGEQIRAREHEGDRIAHEILRRLAERGRRVHMDVTDVHALTMALDDVVDNAEEAADELGRYSVEAPLEAAEALAEILHAATEQVESALTGFGSGWEISTPVSEIHRLEKRADVLLRDSVSSLFAAGIDPMVVIRWKDILETLEAAVDACETVANVLEGASLKRGRRLIRDDL
jgi:uncharacterized protein Yka (UPF0111/DUF47 family)